MAPTRPELKGQGRTPARRRWTRHSV